ncbi:MAG: cation:proton antiporter [bacterium]|jgi:NhaP-type Na+/H+ or K+/H+ antiporter|nr:cation:proton antiporter [bacterium]
MELAFGVLAVGLTLSALVAWLVDRAPISFPIIFLALGVLLGGPTRLLHIEATNQVLQLVGTVTLMLVLFMDAVNLDTEHLRREWLVPALTLGPGTIAVILIVGGVSLALLHFSPLSALLLGAVLASTDAVLMRDLTRDARVPLAVRRALSVEAGTNDVIVLPVVLVLIAVGTSEGRSAGGWVLFGVELFVLSPLVGGAVGAIGAWLMGRVDARFGVRREYQSLYGLGLVFGSYAAAQIVGGDGFLAAFFAGLAISVFDQTLCDCFLEFGQAIAEIAMLLAFMLLGALLVTQVGMVPLLPALALAAVTLLVARPVVTWLLLGWRSLAVSRAARLFIAWFGPRGLTTLLLALLAVNAGVPGSGAVLAAAGVVVIISVIVHGATAAPLAAAYERSAHGRTMPEERVGSAGGLFEESPDDIPRTEVGELARRLEGPDPPVVVDVRTRSQFGRDPAGVPGAVRVAPDEIEQWGRTANPDRDYLLYCT